MLFRLWLVGLFVFPVAQFATSEKPSHPYFEVVSDGESVKHPSKIFNGWSHSPLKIFPIAVNLNFSVSRSSGVSQECIVQITSKKVLIPPSLFTVISEEMVSCLIPSYTDFRKNFSTMGVDQEVEAAGNMLFASVSES